MKILVATAGPVPAKKKAEYIVNIAKRLDAGIIALHIDEAYDIVRKTIVNQQAGERASF